MNQNNNNDETPDTDNYYDEPEQLWAEILAEYRISADDVKEAKDKAKQRFKDEMVPEGMDAEVTVPYNPMRASGPSFPIPRFDVKVKATINGGGPSP